MLKTAFQVQHIANGCGWNFNKEGQNHSYDVAEEKGRQCVSHLKEKNIQSIAVWAIKIQD